MLFASLALVLFLNFVLFCIAYKRQSDRLTDFAYALSFIIVSFSALAFTAHHSSLLNLVIAMVFVWAMRLGSFLVIRIRRSGKDARFDAMRQHFFKFLQFWLGQGLVAWILLLPLLFLAESDGFISKLSLVGVALWLFGLVIETVADLQKYRFSQDPGNKVKWIDTGLWHYSLHPNYFGEMLVWLGVYITTYSSLGAMQRAIGLISPVTIFILLRFVTGVPPLEKSGMKRWGNNPDYRAHLRRTNLLVPFWHRQK